MKSNHFGLATILLTALTIGSFLYLGAIAIHNLDPFPILEFVDQKGPTASRMMHSWDFTVAPTGVRRISMKAASSIDSFSTWSKFELVPSNAGKLADELHARMASIDAHIQRTKKCEQATRTIASIPVRSPTTFPPKWWSPPNATGNATENMLWYPDATFGIAQGCYTIYDPANETLWVYEYAAQHDSHWKRGARPAYAPPNMDKPVE